MERTAEARAELEEVCHRLARRERQEGAVAFVASSLLTFGGPLLARFIPGYDGQVAGRYALVVAAVLSWVSVLKLSRSWARPSASWHTSLDLAAILLAVCYVFWVMVMLLMLWKRVSSSQIRHVTTDKHRYTQILTENHRTP